MNQPERPNRRSGRPASPKQRSAGAAASRLSFAFAAGPLLTEQAARQNIASYAHRHGAVLTRLGQPVGTIAAAPLCRILRAAVEGTSGARRERVESLVRAIAASLKGQGGPIAVPQSALNVLRRYGRASHFPSPREGGEKVDAAQRRPDEGLLDRAMRDADSHDENQPAAPTSASAPASPSSGTACHLLPAFAARRKDAGETGDG